MKLFANSQKNHFKGPCDFLKMKTLLHMHQVHAQPNLQIFSKWTLKNIPDRQLSAHF